MLGSLDVPIEHGEYLYSRNNPINLSDPSGKLVWLGARGIPLGSSLGVANPGVHFYLDIIPNEPEIFSNLGNDRYHFSLSANPKDGNIFGKLVKTPFNYEFQYTKDVRALYTIDPPQGLSDTTFIQRLLDAAGRYGNDRKYRVRGNQRFVYNGNSNNFAYSMLVGAGVDPAQLSCIDPLGISPGWGTSFEEML